MVWCWRSCAGAGRWTLAFIRCADVQQNEDEVQDDKEAKTKEKVVKEREVVGEVTRAPRLTWITLRLRIRSEHIFSLRIRDPNIIYKGRA